MVDRFTSMLDCVELGFLPDGILDELPAPAQLAATRVGEIDLNTPRVRAARPPQRSPSRSLQPGSPSPSSRQKTRPHPPLPRPRACRTNHRRAAHPPRQSHRPPDRRHPNPTTRPPAEDWTTIDRDYETLGGQMHTLLNDLSIATKEPRDRQRIVDRVSQPSSRPRPARPQSSRPQYVEARGDLRSLKERSGFDCQVDSRRWKNVR
jgi:hypothetical protein